MSDDVNIKIAAQNAASAALRQTGNDAAFLTAKLNALRSTASGMKGILSQALGGGNVKSAFSAALGLPLGGGLPALLGGVTALKLAKDSIAAFTEQEDAVKRLESVLEATGGAAELTSKEIQDFATSLQQTTRFADETTIAAASVLGTFNKVKGDQFTGALKSAADIATIKGIGLTEAATLIGKALQAPEEGLSRLKRMGIIFDESVSSNIRHLSDLGQTAQAQDIVLEELNKRFGGAAQHDIETYAGAIAQLKNAVNELGETMGQKLAGPLADWANFFTNIIKSVNGEVPIPRVGDADIDRLTGSLKDEIFDRRMEAIRNDDIKGMENPEKGVAAKRLRDIRVVQKQLVDEANSLIAGGLSTGEAMRLRENENQQRRLRKAADDLIHTFGEELEQAARDKDVLGKLAQRIGGTTIKMTQEQITAATRALTGEGRRPQIGKARSIYEGIADQAKRQAEDQERIVKESQQAAAKFREDLRRRRDAAMTPQEKYDATIERLNREFLAGRTGFDRDLFEREKAAARKELQGAHEGGGGSYPGYVPAAVGRFLTRGPNVDPALMAQKQIAENTKEANDKLDDLKVGIKGLNDNVAGFIDLVGVE